MTKIPERKKQIRRKKYSLAESEEKYRIILDNASDAILLSDEEGYLLEVNKKAEELLGYKRDELLGVNFVRIHPQEEMDKVKSAFLKIKQEGSGTLNSAAILRKDGKEVFVDISGSVIEYSGQKVLQAIFRDITGRKRAEEALRESEENFRRSLDDSPLGIRIVTVNGETLYANKAILDIYGYDSIEELNSTPLKQRYTPESYADFQIRREKRERGETRPSEYEIDILTKNGEIRHVQVFRKKIIWYGEKQFQVIYRDITEQKRIEKDLRQSEEKYRTILESIDDGYYEVDLEGNYTFFNDAEARTIGYSKEELLGMNYRHYQNPESHKKSYEAFTELYQTGKPINALEIEITRKDGTKRYNELSASLITDAHGKPVGFRGITRDITERKQMEDALRQSEERYRTVLEDIEEGYFELDLAGNAVFFNDSMCRIFGYSREESMGMNYKQYTDKESAKKLFQGYNEIYRTGAPAKIDDYEIIRKNGTKRYMEASASLLRDSAGKTIGFRGIVRDITERKKAEDALRKNQEELIKKNLEVEESRKNVQIALEKLETAYKELKATQSKIIQHEKMASIGQLAAGVAHEINNPMAFIASNLGTLNKYIRRLEEFIQAQSEAVKSLKAADVIGKLEKKRKELKLDYAINDIDLLVKESLEGSERVQKIVLELNRFSRVDDEEYKEANINECIESSIDVVCNELKNTATLHKDYGDLSNTKCYPRKLNQVFVNLLINAIQSIEKKGTIKIKTWQKGKEIWITISDTGYGISKKNQGKVFIPFFTTKEASKGTGLGLSVSYDIIQRHKGEISFKSEKGEGTTFTIRIPIV